MKTIFFDVKTTAAPTTKIQANFDRILEEIWAKLCWGLKGCRISCIIEEKDQIENWDCLK